MNAVHSSRRVNDATAMYMGYIVLRRNIIHKLRIISNARATGEAISAVLQNHLIEQVVFLYGSAK